MIPFIAGPRNGAQANEQLFLFGEQPYILKVA
jgi:hypothetical protein